jgi:hypothetical protein
MAEISDAELAALQARAAAFERVNALWEHPKLGPVIKRAAKEAYPDAPIKDFDQAEELRGEFKNGLASVMDTLKQLRQEREEEKTRAEVERKLAEATSSLGLTPAGRERLEKFMVDTGTPDPMVAARALLHDEPGLTGTAAGGGADGAALFDFDAAAKDAEESFADPIKWGVKQLMDGLTAARR